MLSGNDDVASSLRDAGMDVDGSHPSYNAILDHNCELIIGVADIALYEAMTPTDVIPLLPEHPQAVAVDANFLAETLVAIAASLPTKREMLISLPALFKLFYRRHQQTSV